MLSAVRAARLAGLLGALHERARAVDRVSADPLELVHRYADPRDQEVAGLLAASFAYGRVELFKPRVAAVLAFLGPAPARRLRRLTVAEFAAAQRDFVYRFNTAADLGVLLLGMGALLRTHGSLERAFLAGQVAGDWKATLTAFCRAVLEAAPRQDLEQALGKPRGLAHLLPTGPGAHKRLNLYLRWMVRPADGVDLGAWPHVSPAQLMVPLDTHLHRVARRLGLTARNDASWRTALEITQSLAKVAPDDPVRFDFALCHHGMAGACPPTLTRDDCARCPLRAECPTGRARAR